MAGARVTSRRPRIGYATKTETMNRVLARWSSDGATTPPRLLCSTMKSNRTPTTRSTHARSTNRRAKRILLVDDDSTVRDSLNDVLQSEGYLVIPAENGQQALDLANKSSVESAKCRISQRPSDAKPSHILQTQMVNAGPTVMC